MLIVDIGYSTALAVIDLGLVLVSLSPMNSAQPSAQVIKYRTRSLVGHEIRKF